MPNNIKKLILRYIPQIPEERPKIHVHFLEISPTGYLGINKRDNLYFRFKKILTHPLINRVDFLDDICKQLEGSNVQSHFHPTNVLSVNWWNMTQSHIYHFKEVYKVLNEHTMCEAFPVNRTPC